MIWDAIISATQALTHVSFLLWMLGGVTVGVILGVIPAIGGLAGIVLFLPFTFAMRPEQVFPFIIGIFASSSTGGCITSILLGVPGDPVNAATVLDGYPMSKKGQAGRGIGASVTASGLGGVLSGLLALIMIFMIVPFVMAIQASEMVFIILGGIIFIGVLSRGSVIKGMISGALGLLISLIGVHDVTGLPRLTFGTLYLLEGIPLSPFVLGLFALPVMIDLAATNEDAVKVASMVGGIRQVFEGAKDVFRHWGVFLRSSTIGYLLGLIPGVGAMTAIFVAYGQAKQTSKHPELFGTGVVEGVIAPESANNAKESASMLTTLVLGVPSGAYMAVILGAIMMMGLQPGPEMVTKHLDTMITLMYALILGHVVAAVVCFFVAPYVVKITYLPNYVLFAVTITIIFVGAFAYNKYFLDILLTLATGIFAWILVKLHYNIPSLFLGYILGTSFEHYLFLSIQTGGPLFFMRPISLAIIFFITLIFIYRPMKNIFEYLLSKR